MLLLALAQSILPGIGQVIFQANAVQGFMLLAAIALSSPVAAAYALWASIAGYSCCSVFGYTSAGSSGN